jgi:1-acyl-sn-glycerol-3-phosphate acyltransferase
MLFPLFCIPILFKSQFNLIGLFNRWWARLLFIFVGLPFKIEYRFKPDSHKQYIFCPNHFSYLDIPTVGLNKHNTIFVGKSAMEKIPLFGWMYRKLHITVDRTKLKSRYTTLIQAMQAIDDGKSLVIYPEGGILTTNPPEMAGFKDGAFRIAIEKQIPIVPVSIPYNWIILPDREFVLRWNRIKVIFHEPIFTTGLTLDDVPRLKHKLRVIITNELKKHNEN